MDFHDVRQAIDREVSLPAGIAAVSALSLGAFAFLRQRRIKQRVERLGGAALESLLNAIDANDPVTGAHVRRVARCSLVLADALGLDDHTCHSVERVALFHDIGKMHEALFDVIHDSHKLTPAERRAIRTHPDRGAKVLAPLAAFYPDLADGVRSHHERWDGTGYPRQLKGTKIPLAARIVAIADTFDAVTHSRRYRAGRSARIGADVIAEERGTQFDPALVDMFLSPPVMSQIRTEMHRATAVETGGARRAPHGEEVDAPDVSFRWRDTSPSPQSQGRHSRARTMH